ncbi:MAG: carboxypeptidase regulatory-like domain-containing protein [Gemmatimonadaceae bacterium]
MIPTSRTLFASAILAAAILAAAGAVQAQTVIHGIVRDSATHHPIPGARISIAGQAHLITADSAGAFTTIATVRDSATVSAQHLGFRSNTVMIHSQPGDTLRVEVLLAPTANTLAPVAVAAAETEREKVVPPEYRYTRRYDKFFEDRKNNSARGRFYTRADLKSYGGSMARILRSMGVRVTEGPNQTISDVYFYTCPRNTFNGVSWFPTLILDGTHIALDMLSDIRPSDVEMIELFPSAASTPADARGDGCGAIIIFTSDAP